jgi:DNA-binding transcriptional ArsR family regulator
MTNKKLGKTQATYPRPAWVPEGVMSEKELCPECFTVVGEKSRYRLVCLLGKMEDGLTVSKMTEALNLKQPTVTHHLQILSSLKAIKGVRNGREHIYKLNRKAHCFEECKIPYK